MPPPRRHKHRDRVMNQRLGITGRNGQTPYFSWSKTIVTDVLGIGRNPGTTAGATFILPVNNWNDPCGTLGTLAAGAGSLIQDRHPVNHDKAMADKYKFVQVLAWKAVITANWILAESVGGDMIMAYTFSDSNTTSVALTAGSIARIEAMEIQTDPRWTWKKVNAGPGARSKSGNKLIINVPDVYAYCEIIGRGVHEANFGQGRISHVIADVSSTASDFPEIPLFCTVAIFNEIGTAMVVDSIAVTVHITQKVKLMRGHIGSDDLVEGKPDIHG